MQRYSVVGGSSGVGNSASGGVPRDATVRSDLGFSTQSNFPLNARRPVPLTPYTLKCDQEPLSSRLGPPDYFPPTPNCAEESLSREACQNGYKETIDGIEESRETVYTLVNHHHVWTKQTINKYKEVIRKRLNALNNSLLRKRKAGQVYGVPLSGPLLAKSGQFPEPKYSGDDNRKKWIEDLAHNKRLKILAEYVPHGLRRRPLFESLIKNDVPFLRATWCVKVAYLSQVRPLSIGVSGGGADKSQQKRQETWTKDFLEYLQSVLDDLCQHGGDTESSISNSVLLQPNSVSQQSSDFTQTNNDLEDPPLQKKWQYMFRLLQLHFSEGLLVRTQVIEWLLKQLQEKEQIDAVELLLPILTNLIDDISKCQTLLRTIVDILLHKLRNLCPTENFPSASEQPRQYYVATFFTELLSYLLTAVPDSFVALDCFPLPSYMYNRRNRCGPETEICKDMKTRTVTGSSEQQVCSVLKKAPDVPSELDIKPLAEAVQKRAASLAKAVNPSSLRKNEGGFIQLLDKALVTGDINSVYRNMFDEDFCGHEQPPDEWLSRVNPVLLGDTNPGEVFAVRFLCEWSVCDFRDCNKLIVPPDDKNVNVRAACRVHLAVSVLCLRLKELEEKQITMKNNVGADSVNSLLGIQSKIPNHARPSRKGKLKNGSYRSVVESPFFDSPGEIHDTIVAWLDQHEVRKGEGSERMQLLLWELVKRRLFWPPAYVRKLIVSGLLEKETPIDQERSYRHRWFLQQLPWPPGLSADEDGRKNSDPSLAEAIRIHRNERRFCLNGFGPQQFRPSSKEVYSRASGKSPEAAIANVAKPRNSQKKRLKVMDLKQAIGKCLHFPDWCISDLVCSTTNKDSVWHISSKRKDTTEDTGRNKRQKTNDGGSIFIQGYDLSPRDENDLWWSKKVLKPIDTVKAEPIALVKPPKQPSRGRPKAVRKLSLAQLDAARIEGGQGASSSHTSENKVSSNHKISLDDGGLPQNKERKKSSLSADLKCIFTTLRRMRLTDKRAIATWLDVTVRSLVEGGEKQAIPLQLSARSTLMNSTTDDRSSKKWIMGEEEYMTILCLFDIGNDFSSLISFLVWLLPKAVVTSSSQSYRFPVAVWNKDSSSRVSESIILSSLRRYEGIMLATNLLPEVLTAAMQRAAMLSGSGNRTACLSLYAYIHDLYKKYNGLSSLQLWEKNWKSCNDQRLVSELEAIKCGESESSFSLLGVSSPNVGDDRDESVPPRLMGRLVKCGPVMKDLVRRGFHDVISHMMSKERELSVAGISKEAGLERWTEGLHAVQTVVKELLDYIKQQAVLVGAANGEAQLAGAAVSAVVGNLANTVPGAFENNSYLGPGSTAISVRSARRILQLHLQCLRLFKEAFCERQNRVLESALACEATSVVANLSGHNYARAPRPQFQLSPETPDANSTFTDLAAASNGFTLGRPNTAAAAVAALVVSAVLDDVVGLERVISLLKIKEGLENMQLFKSGALSSNGLSRVVSPPNTMKNESMAEVYLFWFRVLIGDCRPVAGGLIAEILGESSMLSFLRVQRLLPLTAVFSPAYSLFSIALRGQHSNREDTTFQQMAYSALGDLLAHDPFCEVCLQDTRLLHDLLMADNGDVEYATLLDSKGMDHATKVSSMVPSRPRLFLHAVLEHKLPSLTLKGHSHTKELIKVLDDIHPATFHWQWLELRLLLNEQTFMEKLDAQNVPMAVEALQAARLEKQNLSESEKNFTDMILTRLLVRPDAAALYSETLHYLGRALEDYLILQVQWVLENSDLVLGRKFLRQQLEEIFHRQFKPDEFKIGHGRVKVWEWIPPQVEELNSVKDNDKKSDATSPEEGEVAEEEMDYSRLNDARPRFHDCNLTLKKQFSIEKALADLVLPCLARSSVETYTRFASRLVKQISDLEQQVTVLSRSSGRSVITNADGGGNKQRLGSRKGPRSGMESGSPGIGRKASSTTDALPLSASALQTSLWLRLQFLLPLLPPIYSDRDQSARNMRSVLASVILRLLGTRFVQESMETFCSMRHDPSASCDLECNAEAASAGENLFDRLLSVLHALLSSTWAVWLKQKPSYKVSSKPPREVPGLDREVVHRMQVDLDHMQVPMGVRLRLQAAMPVLSPSCSITISSGPPQVPPGALPLLQMNLSAVNNSNAIGPITASFKGPLRVENNIGKMKQSALQDLETDIEPWMLLEDVTSSASSSTGGVLVSSDSGSSKACAWLKGAVRIRRTDLTYFGSADDDS